MDGFRATVNATGLTNVKAQTPGTQDLRLKSSLKSRWE